MSHIVSNIMSGLCNCSINTSNLFDQFMSCTEDGTIMFQATLAYSNADGSETASGLVARAKSWIAGRRNVNGMHYDIETMQTSTDKVVLHLIS